MISHHVLFWLKDDISETEYNEFKTALEDLEQMVPVPFFHVGTPAAIERDVVDGTYSFSLFVAFDDMQSFEAYQKHPQHIAFLNGPNKHATKVVIYDAD